MATLLPVDGPPVFVAPRTGDRFSLQELRTFVGGYIEAVRLNPDEWLIVNEEGKLEGLPVNTFATWLLRRLRPHDTDTIVGDALVCNTQEAGGEM